MDEGTRDALLSALRSALVTIGGALATTGVFGANTTEGQIALWAGVIVAIIGAVWGVWDKFQKAREVKTRETIAVQAGIASQAWKAPEPPPAVTPAQAQTLIKTFVGTGDGK